MLAEWIGYIIVASIAVGGILGGIGCKFYLTQYYDQEISSLELDKDTLRNMLNCEIKSHQATLKRYDFDNYNPTP